MLSCKDVRYAIYINQLYCKSTLYLENAYQFVLFDIISLTDITSIYGNSSIVWLYYFNVSERYKLCFVISN